MEQEIAHGVYAKYFYQLIRIKHISPGLAHLALSLQQPGMAENLLGQGQVQRHQENRPINGMEADNVLAD